MKQKNIDKIYFSIKNKFGFEEFTFGDLVKFNLFNYDERSLTTILSRLRKKGFLKVRKDDKNMRRSIYQLVPMSQAFGRGYLISLLKKAADVIRGKADYRVLLIILFYKAVSDIWKKEFEEVKKALIKEGLNEEEAEKEALHKEYHNIYLSNPKKILWGNVINSKENLVVNLRNAIYEIGENNPQISDAINIFIRSFDDMVGKHGIDVTLRQVMDIFNEINFSELDSDALGDAYEWLINYFAPQKNKAGELFTPREVVKLLVEILGPKEHTKILDPAAGSGGMLLYAYKEVRDKYGLSSAKKLFLVGQESQPINYAILRLNFLLHGINIGKNVKLYLGDSIVDPKYENDGPFDMVIFNPPWNQDGYGESRIKKLKVGSLFSSVFPPGDKADWLWIYLALHNVKKDGKVGIVIDNGCLFRGGKEKILRKEVIDKDYIEAVILLPAKLFFNTGAPGTIMIFNKNKPRERKGKILFINASDEYEKHPEIRKNNRLTEEGIRKIVDVYNKFKSIKGFSKVVPVSEIVKNDYSLNVSLYVETLVEHEDINVPEHWKKILEIEKELSQVDKQISNFVKLVEGDGAK